MPKTPDEIYAAGIDAMVHSFMELIEPCIKRRCEQIMGVVKEGVQENKCNLKLIAAQKPTGKFIATYNDGSGCIMLKRLDDGNLVDGAGEEYQDEFLDSCLFWIPLPDDFKFFNDNKEEK